MDIDKLTHAVDQARIQMYATYGVALPGFDVEKFAELMAADLGIDAPVADGPQPPVEVVASPGEAPEPETTGGSMGAGAEIAEEDEAEYVLHRFVVDRGGKDCITCHLPESEGHHSP